MASLAGLASNATTGIKYGGNQNLSYYQQPDLNTATAPPVAASAPNNLMQIEQARAGGDNNGSPTAANYGNNPQSAPTGTAAAPAPKLTDYAAQYEASLAAQRATIAHQIASALADINQQEAGGRQAVGLLPGQLNTIYNTGNASMAQSAGTLDAAQKASGLQSYMGAGAQMAPVAGAIAADRAARQADVPLLQIGLAQAAAAQHAALQQASLGAYGQVDQQQAQFILAQQQAQAAAQQHAADQRFAMQQQQTGADLSLRNTLAASAGGTDASTAQALHDQQTNLDKAGITDVTAPEAQAARSSPLYTYAMGRVHGGDSLNDIFNAQELKNPNVAKIIEVLHYDLGLDPTKTVQPRGAAPTGSYFGYDAGNLGRYIGEGAGVAAAPEIGVPAATYAALRRYL
jgi:hypothetical protein